MRAFGRDSLFHFDVYEDPSPPPLEEDPSYELEVEQRGWRKALAWASTLRGALIVSALVLLLIGVWQAKAIYGATKTWRATRLIARCEEAALAGDETAELRSLRQAFALLPSTPLTMRALARYQERRSEAGSFPTYEKLLATGEATTDDSIRAARVGLAAGRIEWSREILSRLHRDPKAGALPAVLALDARVLAMEGSWNEALTTARKAIVNPGGDNGAEKIILATLLLQAADRAPVEARQSLATEAVDLLAQLAVRLDDPGVEALNALISIARQPAAAQLLAGRDVSSWVEFAQRHPKASPKLRIMAWNIQLAAKADEPEKFYASFLDNARSAPLLQRLEAARWLNQRSKTALSLELSTPEKETSSDWFLVYLDALAAKGDWEGVLAHLETKSGQAAAMPGALRSLFAFRARCELKQPLDRAEVWRDLQIQLQSETVRNQIYVAQYAEKTGETRQAAIIYRRLLDESTAQSTFDRTLSGEEKFNCYTGLIRSFSEVAPAAELVPLFEALSKDFPEMEEARNDAIYLRLLTGQVVDGMREDLQNLLTKKPTLLAYRSTGVLYELRKGNLAAAAQLYDGWQIDWTTAADRYKVVRVAALDAVGKHDEAQSMRASINRGRLRPEEAALLDTASPK